MGLNTLSVPDLELGSSGRFIVSIELLAYDCEGRLFNLGEKWEKRFGMRIPLDTAIWVEQVPSAYRVYQRNPREKSARLEVKGTVTERLDKLRVRVISERTGGEIVGWKTLGISQGRFGDSVDVPQGGWYRFQYSGSNGAGEQSTLFSPKFGVGMNILCIGQSNMSGRGVGEYKSVPDLGALYGNNGRWSHLADPYDRNGVLGQVDNDGRNPSYSMVPELIIRLLALGFPVGIVPASNGSTAMAGDCNKCWSFRNASNHRDTTNLYGNSLSKADKAGGVELILLAQGEKDIGIGYAAYRSAFENMVSHYREDLADSIPIFFSQLGNNQVDRDFSGYFDITMAQRDVADGKSVFLAAQTMDLEVLPPDSVHYTAASLDSLGDRFSRSILAYLLSHSGDASIDLDRELYEVVDFRPAPAGKRQASGL